jgi:hypothetical protein
MRLGRRAVAAGVRRDDPVAGLDQRADDARPDPVEVGVRDEPVQEDDGRAAAGVEIGQRRAVERGEGGHEGLIP